MTGRSQRGGRRQPNPPVATRPPSSRTSIPPLPPDMSLVPLQDRGAHPRFAERRQLTAATSGSQDSIVIRLPARQGAVPGYSRLLRGEMGNASMPSILESGLGPEPPASVARPAPLASPSPPPSPMTPMSSSPSAQSVSAPVETLPSFGPVHTSLVSAAAPPSFSPGPHTDDGKSVLAFTYIRLLNPRRANL
jgi:hypothetical protein